MKIWKKSANNLLFSLIYQVSTIVLGLILPRVILLGFGSEINGLLNSVTQAIAYMALFESGIQSVATKSLYDTIARNDDAATNGVLAAVNSNYQRIGRMYFAGLLMLSAVYPVLVDLAELSYMEVFLVVLFSGLGNVVAFFKQAKYRILLIADGREYIITNLNTVVLIAGNVLKIILLTLRVKVYIVIMAVFLISFVQVVFIDRYVRRVYPWIDLNEKPNHYALIQSKYVLVHQISGLVFSNTDMLLLTIFCDLKVVSVYAIYKMIVGHISSFIAMPYNSCSFILGQTFHVNRERFINLFDGIQVIFNTLVFSLLTVTYILLPPFITLYTAGVNDVVYLDDYLPFLFVAAELLNLIRIPTRHAVNCAGHFQETLSRTLIETGINLVTSIIGVYVIGIYGVLLGTIAALLYRSVDFAIYANKDILQRSVVKNLILYVLNLGVSAAVILTFETVSLQITSYIRFFATGLTITIPIVLVFAVLNLCFFRKDILHLYQSIRGLS